MYIQFRLPSGAGGQAAGHALVIIQRELAKWAEAHNIPYQTKTHKYTFQVYLELNEHYTWFQLSWNPSSSYFCTYQLIETEQ